MDSKVSKVAPRTRPVKAGPPRQAGMKGKPSIWLVLQGDTVELVDSPEMPSLDVRPGERMKKILGSYTDRAVAQDALSYWKIRAPGRIGKGQAY